MRLLKIPNNAQANEMGEAEDELGRVKSEEF
jgi:hypothetical protein